MSLRPLSICSLPKGKCAYRPSRHSVSFELRTAQFLYVQLFEMPFWLLLCVYVYERNRERQKHTHTHGNRDREREKGGVGREREREMPSLKCHHWMCECCYLPMRCHIMIMGIFFLIVCYSSSFIDSMELEYPTLKLIQMSFLGMARRVFLTELLTLLTESKPANIVLWMATLENFGP